MHSYVLYAYLIYPIICQTYSLKFNNKLYKSTYLCPKLCFCTYVFSMFQHISTKYRLLSPVQFYRNLIEKLKLPMYELENCDF